MTCPDCLTRIDDLWYSILQWEGGWFYAGPEYSTKTIGDIERVEYRCYHCECLIATDEDEAVAFLEGEGPWPII